MKKILFAFFILWASSAFAAPFLVCDQDVNHDRYEIVGLTQEPIQVDAVDNQFHYDLADLPNGEYEVQVRAYNDLWGMWSDLSTPYDVKKNVNTPSMIRLERE